MAALIDPAYKGEDTIIEDLMSFYEEERIEVDEWFHDKPYSTLVNVMYNDDSLDAAEKLKRYCKEWYPSFKQTPWHDSHLTIDGTEGNYYGYWAFEAAAVSYLYKIDDSKIDHIVYPRDLADFARNFKK